MDKILFNLVLSCLIIFSAAARTEFTQDMIKEIAKEIVQRKGTETPLLKERSLERRVEDKLDFVIQNILNERYKASTPSDVQVRSKNVSESQEKVAVIEKFSIAVAPLLNLMMSISVSDIADIVTAIITAIPAALLSILQTILTTMLGYISSNVTNNLNNMAKLISMIKNK